MAIGSPQWMYKSGEAYTVDQSLKFEDGKSPKLTKTFASAGNRRTWTFSCWVKKNKVSGYHVLLGCGTTGDYEDLIYFDTTNNNFRFAFGDGTGNTRATAAYYRDTSAWMHVMVAVDSTQSTAADRIKMYVNGVLNTTWAASSNNDPAQNFDFRINTAAEHYIGVFSRISSHADFYLADMNFIDGQQLTPSDFGETGTYGEWKPIEYSGTYGTNGFYLPFKQDYTVEGFSTVTYKGTGTADHYIGGAGFKPSLTWLKPRSLADHNLLYDRVRGYSSQIKSNSANAEDITSKVLPATDGILLTTTDQNQNSSSHTYVAWNWDMGADTPTGFGCVTYRGGNVANQTVTGFNFSPDLLWIKDRDAANSHHIFDQVRGVNKRIRSDSTAAEDSSNDSQRAFLPDGFRLGAAGTGVTVNGNDYVAWGWDMGSSDATNTTGTITSTVRANPTYGQSIVSYTGNQTAGATVGHGLSSAPEMMIVKNRELSSDFIVYHSALGNTKHLRMTLNSPEFTSAIRWNNTSPTSSVFSLGTDSSVNENNDGCIAYCFHSVSGYSKIGSYTGNGSTTGPSVTLGFRPAFVMIKVADRTDGGNGGWWMFDSTRSFGTAIGNVSIANTNGAELVNNSNLAIDFNSNGFQLKSSYDEINVNGGTYVYYAVAGGVDSISAFNTDGTSESRVKANTTYGQSIVTYKGKSGAQTIGHGLNSAPEVIIAKNRSSAQEWLVYHHSLTDAKDKYLRLDTTAAVGDNTFWNDTAPTSSVFSVGDSQPINSGHGNDYFAYCFHSVTGYSKFGTYNGNGTSNGSNAVNCGFEPAFVMIKCTNDIEAWWIFDNVRNPLNGGEDPKRIAANESNAEVTGGSTGSDWVEFTSTGFKMTGAGGGTNGGSGQVYVYMAFADKREYAYWLDQSGNNNDWTSNNLTESDISVDSPTNNFCTWNPSHRGDAGSNLGTLSEGNLKIHYNEAGSGLCLGTMAPTSGKWYCEFTYIHGDAASDRTAVGIADPDSVDVDANGNDKKMFAATTTDSAGLNRLWLTDNVESDNNFPERLSGSIIQFAWDMDAGKFWIGTNNQWSNSSGGNIPISDVVAGNNPTVTDSGCVGMTPVSRLGAGLSLTNTHFLNCGQDSSFSGIKTSQGNQDSNGIGDFYYEPPTGFLALCTSNLPDVAVVPSEHFEAILYTGTGSEHEISSLNFQPDLAWIRERPNVSNHYLYDSVRGATKVVYSDGDYAEQTDAQSLKSFDSDGYTLGTNTGVNQSSTAYVAWNWKANGSGSSNSNGSITSTVSANTDAGFSIIKYHGNATAGATIGHGLSKAPELVICKDREAANGWGVGTFNENNTKALYLNSSGGWDTNNYWNSTNPSSTVITLGISGATNANNEMIAYAFHSVEGYSKIGSYISNSNNDGPFIFTGFRPAFIMCKSASYSNSETFWVIHDNKRPGYNVTNLQLYANSTLQEAQREDGGGSQNTKMDFLSNGFKHRDSTWSNNASSGNTYIYIAFAETPFKYSNGR